MRLLLLPLLFLTVPASADVPTVRHFTTSDYTVITSPEPGPFEPSAAAAGPHGEVYLWNDKSDELSPIMLQPDGHGGFGEPSVVSMPQPVTKVEAAAVADGEIWVLTSCSYDPVDDLDNWQLLSFTAPSMNREAEMHDYSAELRTALRQHMEDYYIGWVKLEGLAVGADGRTIYLGVRESGTDYTAKHFVAAILSFTLGSDQEGLTTYAWVDNTCDEDGHCWGLSSLEFSADGQTLWAMTSWEDGDRRDQVAGQLFRIKAEDLQYKLEKTTLLGLFGHPVATFDDKPEGLACLNDGRIFVAFDSDGDRKNPVDPTKFALHPNQDYCIVLDPAKLPDVEPNVPVVIGGVD